MKAASSLFRRLAFEADEVPCARLVRDFLAGMTNGDAARTQKRWFSPDFGVISDLIG